MSSKKTFLGDFELMVLLAILRLDKDAYGAAILDEIHKRTGRPVSGGALYITLDRLEDKGYLKSKLSDPSSARGGRPRRYVKVTARGFQAVRESRKALISLWGDMEAMFEKS